MAILVLTGIRHKQYQIKNAVSFPNAPRGTSEQIIYRVMSDLQDEGVSADEADHDSEGETFTKTDIEIARKIQENSSHSRSRSIDSGRSDSPLGSENSSGQSSPTTGLQHSGIAVTFGITASDSLVPVSNLSGWKITWLSKTYSTVISLTGLTRRGDFRVRLCSYFSHNFAWDLLHTIEQVPLAACTDVCLLPLR